MSDNLTKPSTTPGGQKITQSGIITLPDINFSINLDIKVNIDPEMKTLLKNVFSRTEDHVSISNIQPEIDVNQEIRPEDLPEDEPTELSVNIPPEVVTPAASKGYGTIISASSIKWNKVAKYPKFDWRENGSTLILRYSNISHDTKWSTIARLLRFTGSKRTREIEKVIGSKTSKKITAFNIFCRLVDEGVIKIPVNPDAELEGNFSKFLTEEDPDAVYRLMVTPPILTRPDFENGGKVEGTLEA